MVDTVAGVVTVSNSGPGLWARDDGWTVTGPVARIGSVEGDGPAVFGGIGAVARASDGTILVADVQALEVRVFSPEGRFVRAFGRGGEGPGEFGHIDGLVVEPSGTMAVRDPRLARLSRFASGGAFQASFRLERPFLIFSDGTTFWVDREGRLYDRINLVTPVGAPARIAMVRYSSDGLERDTFPLLDHDVPRVLSTRDGQPVVAMSAPFAARALVAVDGAGRIASALGDAYRIAVRDGGGDTLFVFGRDLEPLSIPAGERDSAEAAIRSRVEEMAPGARLGDVPLPEHRPFIHRLRADDGGHWWVGRYRGERSDADPSARFPTAYDVFDPRGRFLGTVETPAILITEITEGSLVGVETDELGVQYAVVYAVSR